MKAIGAININSIRIHELEKNMYILSIGTNSPATGSPGVIPFPRGPDLTVKA
jgi:hypothetical protein